MRSVLAIQLLDQFYQHQQAADVYPSGLAAVQTRIMLVRWDFNRPLMGSTVQLLVVIVSLLAVIQRVLEMQQGPIKV